MKMHSLKPYYFRAFQNGHTIEFGDKLTIFWGSNGTGKSSLSEAIEWLLYGFTVRRRKGNNYSKNEHFGSYVNKWWDENKHDPPYVEAEVEVNGAVHTIRRTVRFPDSGRKNDEDSLLTIDGQTRASDLAAALSLGFNEGHRPVVVQHGIQDFIHTRPKDRYRTISDALGLRELIGFKDALEKAKNQFRNNLPVDVQQAKRDIYMLIESLKRLNLNDLADSWRSENFNITTDYQRIIAKAQSLTNSSSTDLTDIIQSVEARQKIEQEKIFNFNRFLPPKTSPQLLENIETSLLHQFPQQIENLLATAQTLLQVTASQYSQAQLVFWEAGLALIDQNTPPPHTCPLCEEDTITKRKIDNLKQRGATSQASKKAKINFDSALSECLNSLAAIKQKLRQLQITSLGQNDQTKLLALFSTPPPELHEFKTKNQDQTQSLAQLLQKITEGERQLKHVKDKISTPLEASNIANKISNLPADLQKEFDHFKTRHLNYTRITPKFEIILNRELADEATVQKFTDLRQLLTKKSQVELIAIARKMENDVSQCQQETGAHIKQKQKAELTTREKDIVNWFDTLYPDPDVLFDSLVPGHEKFELKAKVFDKDMDIAANFSQAQLNCLGLAVSISNVVTLSSPFSFILFDDPVQAMDDEHHENFIVKVVPTLINNQQIQMIVLTHLKKTAKRLYDTNRHIHPIYYQFDNLEQTGVQLSKYFRFKKELDHIKRNAKGNSEKRKWAIDRIRILGEAIIKETYKQKISNSLEDLNEIATVSAKELLIKYGKIPSVSQKEVQGLSDTINWANPAHHEDDDWTVPSFNNIQPHISRIETQLKKLGLL